MGSGGQALRSTGRRARSVMDRPPRPTATMPDWTSSLIPNGSSTRISASSLSRLPVASTVTASRATSTTLARKSWTVSSTFDRLSVSARTLISSSSRWTACPCSSSTILSTLISLLSCLVTCSSGCSSQFTTIVIREISSCSVGPTASESMLNPRRENSPEILTRTPGLFSTSTDSVCLLIVVLPLLLLLALGWTAVLLVGAPVGGQVAGEQDGVVAGAGRDHRPHHGVAVHDEVDHHRAVVDLHGLLDHRVHVLGPLTAERGAAVGLSQLHEVRDPGPGQRPRGLRRPRHRARQVGRGAGPAQVGVGVALAVEQGLPLADHAEGAVVDDGDLDRDALQGAGGQLLVWHLQAAVAGDRPRAGVPLADLGPHRGRGRLAHGARATGVQPGPRLLVADELGGPHLVLADAGRVDGLRAGDLADALDHVLRGQRAIGRLFITHREGGPPGVQLGPPGVPAGPAPGLLLGLDRGDQVGDDLAAVA